MVRLLVVFALAGLSVVSLPSLADARSPIVVLVGTPVAENARETMSPPLWAKLVANWVDANTQPFGGVPTLADCKTAKAYYMVSAPFDLKPRLPGSLHVNDRVAAQSRVVVTNCVTGAVVFDKLIPLESNRISTSNEGDFEPVSEITWESAVRGTLRTYPIIFSQTSYVTRVDSPFVYLSIGAKNLTVGQTLRIYASGDGAPKEPIILTIVDISGKLVQAQFDATNPKNIVRGGDLVEPYVPK